MPRKRVGYRRHRAIFRQHNGTIDANGLPTYSDPSDWIAFTGRWPCELITASGGEVLRGIQVQAEANAVLYGHSSGIDGITPQMRCEVDGITYSVIAVIDPDGLDTERRIEMRREV